MASQPSTLDKIKFAVGALGSIAAGLVIASGPGTLPEEIPYYVEIGMGFVGFGVLMLLALVSVRVKALLVAIVVGLVSAVALFAAFSGDLPIWQAALAGILGVVAGVYAIFCLIDTVKGIDPT